MTRARVAAIIPARFAATRLPGKPLLPIAGKPMIQHVWERARRAQRIDTVLVATDDERIADAVRRFGGEVVMTRVDHLSGTDRLVEAAATLPADIYLNVQGDEPLVRPDDLDRLADAMLTDDAPDCATLACAISAEQAQEPDRVKLITDSHERALYFSRAPIPYARSAPAARYRQHLGIYAFRAAILARWPGFDRPMSEQAESLEQLRLLHAGVAIHVVEVAPTAPGVDTPESLALVRAIFDAGAAE